MELKFHLVTPNAVLRDVIFRRGLSQQTVADAAGINRTVLSQIIRGRVNPTDAEREAIARALGESVERLFANAESVAS